MSSPIEFDIQSVMVIATVQHFDFSVEYLGSSLAMSKNNVLRKNNSAKPFNIR